MASFVCRGTSWWDWGSWGWLGPAGELYLELAGKASLGRRRRWSGDQEVAGAAGPGLLSSPLGFSTTGRHRLEMTRTREVAGRTRPGHQKSSSPATCRSPANFEFALEAGWRRREASASGRVGEGTVGAAWRCNLELLSPPPSGLWMAAFIAVAGGSNCHRFLQDERWRTAARLPPLAPLRGARWGGVSGAVGAPARGSGATWETNPTSLPQLGFQQKP
jgi:hypothetical protein